MNTIKELTEIPQISNEGEYVSKKDYEELNDKYLRSVSDYQNLKRRTEINNNNVYLEMKKNAFNNFLPIIDDLDRAANAIQDPSLFMIFRKAIVMLSENGILQYGQEGDLFDDAKHNAVLVEYDNTKEDNTILKILKHGYILNNEHVIRYADVVVNKLNLNN